MKFRDKLLTGFFVITIVVGLPALGWLYRDNQESRISLAMPASLCSTAKKTK